VKLVFEGDKRDITYHYEECYNVKIEHAVECIKDRAAFDRIANGDKTKFLKLYDQMKQKIINNPEMLYKDYWKK